MGSHSPSDTAVSSSDLPPLGIKLYAGFVGVLAVLVLFAALAIHPFAFLIALPFVAVDVAAAYGLWHMKTWAWYLAVGLKVLGLFIQLGGGDPGFVLTLIILGYLLWVRDLYL